MRYYSTREAAKRLGIPNSTLANYVAVGKIAGPVAEVAGITTTRLWTEGEIKDVRKRLPKIANGRKSRYQKKQSAVSNQQSAKARKKRTQKKK